MAAAFVIQQTAEIDVKCSKCVFVFMVRKAEFKTKLVSLKVKLEQTVPV